MRVIILFILILLDLGSMANVRLPSILSNHMVLQQKTNVIIWGWCDPMETIKLFPGWDTIVYSTVGTNEAKWQIELSTPEAGGPYNIMIEANQTVLIEDVMIGEVWLCGGQSNMEFSGNHGIKQAIEESSKAANNNIRFFFTDKSTSNYPQENCSGEWRICTPDEMMKFSAVGYFFGKELFDTLNIPIGLINNNWAGTPAEVWTPSELIVNDSTLNLNKEKVWKSEEWWPTSPGVCYNAMIFPIVRFKLSGVIWYQGESNADAFGSYKLLFSTLIESWRASWNLNFPFYFVQIAPFSGYQGKYTAALLREAQAECLALPNTGMVVIHDLIDAIDAIHPQKKKEVGIRLAMLALADHYQKPLLSFKSPTFDSVLIKGNEAVIIFKDVVTGLKTNNGLAPDCFVVAGEDKFFYPANARIEDDKVIVSNFSTGRISSVRFGFNNTDRPNLISNEGLPVASFRTDKWILIQ